jgi:hypothetical protein
MKFLVTKELHQNPLLRSLVLFFVAVLSLFLLSDIVLHHYQIGLTPSLATETLLGNEDAFIEPLLFDVLLERVHSSIFTSMITLILLSIIFMRVQDVEKNKLIHIAFLSAIFTPLCLILAYFYGSVFIAAWIALFLLWHSVALYLSFFILWKLFRS